MGRTLINWICYTLLQTTEQPDYSPDNRAPYACISLFQSSRVSQYHRLN